MRLRTPLTRPFLLPPPFPQSAHWTSVLAASDAAFTRDWINLGLIDESALTIVQPLATFMIGITFVIAAASGFKAAVEQKRNPLPAFLWCLWGGSIAYFHESEFQGAP